MTAINMDFTTATLDEWMPHVPVGGFDVILADPAWRYSSNSAAKPEWVQDHIDARLPGFTKAELFARRARSGWTVFGNEVGEVAA